MAPPPNPAPNHDDHVLAAAAHGSIYGVQIVAITLVAGGGIAANSAFHGKDFRYLVIGNHVRRPEVAELSQAEGEAIAG